MTLQSLWHILVEMMLTILKEKIQIPYLKKELRLIMMIS